MKAEDPTKNDGRFYRWSERGFSGMHNFYARSLKWVLQHEYLMLIVTAAVIVAIGFSTSWCRKDFSRNRTPGN